MLRFEGVGDVLQKDETEDNVLVLRRVHIVPERIRHAPELRFVNSRKRAVSHLTRLSGFWDLL